VRNWSVHAVHENFRAKSRQRLEDHQAECVRPRGEDEDIAGCIITGELFAEFGSDEADMRVFDPEFGELRSVADNQLRAGQIERQKSFDVFFHRDAADIEINRSRQIEPIFRARLKQLDVDAARP